jgi:hypothetical protein
MPASGTEVLLAAVLLVGGLLVDVLLAGSLLLGALITLALALTSLDGTDVEVPATVALIAAGVLGAAVALTDPAALGVVAVTAVVAAPVGEGTGELLAMVVALTVEH